MYCAECGLPMCGHNMPKGTYYRCTSGYKKYTDGNICKYVGRRMKTEKVDNVVWSWLKELLCDPEALEIGLQEMIESRADEVGPKRDRVVTLEKLIGDEDKKVKRLVAELAYHDDEIVLEAIRQEINYAMKSRDVLSDERDHLELELSNIVVSENQKNQVLIFAAEIARGLENADFEQKRFIMDTLAVRAGLHYEDETIWLEVSCAITADNDAIVLHPS